MKGNEYAIQLHDLYAGGLLVISLVILQAFLSLTPLDLTAVISVVAFSIAIPLLAGILVVNVIENKYPYSSPHLWTSKLVDILIVVGILADLVGIGAAFWHTSRIAGITFTITAIIASVAYACYIRKLEE